MLGPLVLGDPARVSLLAAELVANRLLARPGLRLILPTGHTPLGMYAALRAHAEAGDLPTGGATLFQLDEYLGLGPGDGRSFAAYLDRELATISFGTVHSLDGSDPEPERRCEAHQRLLDAAPVDLVVLGLGRDGHVAFDEPGSPVDAGTRVVELHPTTRSDAAADFGGLDDVPRRALTVGLRTLRGARELLLLVTGAAKAAALRATLEAPPEPGCPASLLRDHPRLTVVCDTEAASRLRPVAGGGSDMVMVVLGHRERGAPPDRISEESRARLRAARYRCETDPPRVVIFTGYSHTPEGLSEAEQMKAAWDLPRVPTLLEDAGRNTAENAARSLPIIRAIGELHRVVVVTSSWHVRAPYFFAPYRGLGLGVSFAFARHRTAARVLLNELAGLPRMRAQRRRAFRTVSG